MSTNDSLQSSSFNSPYPSRILQRADSSFEVIDDIEDDTQILNNSLAKKSLRNSLLNPLQSLIQQNKDLKELLEKCNKKMASVKEEKETVLRELEEERNKCRALEEETLRLQVEITSLHKKVAEVTKERDDAFKTFVPSTKDNTNDQEFSTESNTGGIKLDAMRKSKMEMLVKNVTETKQQLEEYQRHLASKDSELMTARKKFEEMRSRMLLLEEKLAQEKGKKVEKETELSSMQRSVSQLNMKLTQEMSTYNDEITTLSDTHSKEVSNLKVDYNERMKDLQQTIVQLNQKV